MPEDFVRIKRSADIVLSINHSKEKLDYSWMLNGVSVVTGVELILAVVFFLIIQVLPPQIIDNTLVIDNSIVGIDSETVYFQIKESIFESK